VSDSRPPYTPFAPFDQRVKLSPVPPPSDPSAAEITVPAPPPLPTDTDLTDHSPDREDANWLMMRSALAALSQQQADFMREQREAIGEFFAHVDRRLSTFSTAINERLSATDRLLIGRFDGVDERLDEHSRKLDAMNQILTGVRHATDSALDVATTAAREIREVRRSSIPDHAPAASLKAVAGAKQEDGGG
jgi:hypothetical protein